MLGMTGAVGLVLARLQAELPAKITEISTRYSLPAGQLQTPASYMVNMYDRIELAQFPAIQIAPRAEGAPAMMDQDQGVFVYKVGYDMRIYLEVRGLGYDQVEQRRQLTTLGIREVLFSTPQLGAAPDIFVVPGSVRSTYYGIGEIDAKDQRAIAATYTDLTVMVEEMTELPSPWPYTADTIVSTVGPMPAENTVTWERLS